MVRKNRGFTIIELLVVVAIMAVLTAIVVPSLAAAVRSARKTACAANLGSIGRAMLMYATSERSYSIIMPPLKVTALGKWTNPPSAPQCDDGTSMSTMYFGSPTKSPALRGDPFANQWMLVAENYVPNPKIFVCPSDPNQPAAAQVRYSPPVWVNYGTFLNFGTVGDLLQAPSPTLSYGFQYPWADITSNVPRWWSGDGNAARVLAADMGPSMSPPVDDPTSTTTSAGNSKNHAGTGQNVLFADGHVSFELTNAVGIGGDDIYTGDGGNIYVMSGGQKFNTVANLNANFRDTLLVPAYP